MSPLQFVVCRPTRIIPTQRIIDTLDGALETGMECVIWESRTPSAELVLRTWAKRHGLHVEDRMTSPESELIVRRTSDDREPRIATFFGLRVL